MDVSLFFWAHELVYMSQFGDKVWRGLNFTSLKNEPYLFSESIQIRGDWRKGTEGQIRKRDMTYALFNDAPCEQCSR